MRLRLSLSSSITRTSVASEFFINDFDSRQITGELSQLVTNRRIIFSFGRLLQSPTDLGNIIETVTAAGAFHAMAQYPDRFVVIVCQGAADRLNVAAPVVEKFGNQIFQILVGVNDNHFGVTHNSFPPANWAMVSINFGFLIGLVTWPLQPASKDFSASPASACAVSATIGVGANPCAFSQLRIAWVAL